MLRLYVLGGIRYQFEEGEQPEGAVPAPEPAAPKSRAARGKAQRGRARGRAKSDDDAD